MCSVSIDRLPDLMAGLRTDGSREVLQDDVIVSLDLN